MQYVKEVMTDKDLICCEPGDSIEYAARLMKEHKIGCLLVVEDKVNMKLAGIVTDRDIVRRCVAKNIDPAVASVAAIMTVRLETVASNVDEDVPTAIEAMSECQIRRLPVIDADGRVVGIISLADIARAVPDEAVIALLVCDLSRDTVRTA